MTRLRLALMFIKPLSITKDFMPFDCLFRKTIVR